MKQVIQSEEQGYVYPGEYIPLAEMEVLLHELNPVHAVAGSSIPINVDDREDAMEIEMLVPGIAFENILLTIKGDNLYVVVKHFTRKGNTLKVHGLDDLCLDGVVPLPSNGDTELVSAHFRFGKLCIYVPKSEHPLKPEALRNIPIY